MKSFELNRMHKLAGLLKEEKQPITETNIKSAKEAIDYLIDLASKGEFDKKAIFALNKNLEKAERRFKIPLEKRAAAAQKANQEKKRKNPLPINILNPGGFWL
jgi:hypothetical protein